MSNLPALPRTINDLVAEYDRKVSAIDAEIAELKHAYLRINMAATVQGTYVRSLVREELPWAKDMRLNLLQSGWRAVYNRLQIDRIASAKDKALFERTLADPPELTVENARATFGRYFEDPRWQILRGLAEAFVDLDPAYKSHSKVRVGVKGLPKRVILPYWGSYYSSGGREKFRDLANALATFQGKPHVEHSEMLAIDAAHKSGVDAVLDGRSYETGSSYRRDAYATLDRGLTVRLFRNGNAHVFFTPPTLLDINRALAEFYGDVLPDVEDDAAPKRASSAVAKDLQFYWSPPAVVAAALELAGVHEAGRWSGTAPKLRVLEPSCGDGRILDAVRDRGHDGFGIEVHEGRAGLSRARGHRVLTANFLEQPATGDFDAVVMNPPFYGRHYLKHVRHALGFLKPGGVLVAVLPATAHYDHGELAGEWRDLPVASFAESGTNVPTGLLKIVKGRGG